MQLINMYGERMVLTPRAGCFWSRLRMVASGLITILAEIAIFWCGEVRKKPIMYSAVIRGRIILIDSVVTWLTGILIRYLEKSRVKSYRVFRVELR